MLKVLSIFYYLKTVSRSKISREIENVKRPEVILKRVEHIKHL